MQNGTGADIIKVIEALLKQAKQDDLSYSPNVLSSFGSREFFGLLVSHALSSHFLQQNTPKVHWTGKLYPTNTPTIHKVLFTKPAERGDFIMTP